MRLTLVTANIGRKGMTAEKVKSDMKKIKKRFGTRQIIGWQEIDEADPADEHRILKSQFRYSLRFRNSGLTTFVPITVGWPLKVTRETTTFASEGIPYASPHRVINVVKVEGRWNKNIKFVFINLHYPAGAFNGRVDNAERARLSAWHEVFEVHKGLVRKYVNQGYTVIWVGDTNRMDMLKTHPHERQIVTAGIDSISVIEGGMKVKVLEKGSFTLNSDHDARFATVEITKKK